ncbi:hypothetical protein [Microbacterium sp. ProA8]|uniref:hypothetical protein n=1 Tax=Microbacterium chionoecetis TaxID=3153754 RepID=UPI003267413B
MVAIDNPGSEMSDLMRRVRFLETQSGADGVGFGGGDSSHAGAGLRSIQLGTSGSATGQDSVALGPFALATDDFATALGPFCEASNQNSFATGIDAVASGIRAFAAGLNALASGAQSAAVGRNTIASHDQTTALGDQAVASHSRGTAIGTGAQTTAANQMMLGTASDTVVVPGTFSNPSARHLKRNIIPAPSLRDIFPDLTEWEYIDGDGRRRLGYIADDLVGTDAERFVTFDAEGRPAGIDYLGLLVVQNAQLQARLTVLENLMRG